jgi:hypothetical protein
MVALQGVLCVHYQTALMPDASPMFSSCIFEVAKGTAAVP